MGSGLTELSGSDSSRRREGLLLPTVCYILIPERLVSFDTTNCTHSIPLSPPDVLVAIHSLSQQ